MRRPAKPRPAHQAAAVLAAAVLATALPHNDEVAVRRDGVRLVPAELVANDVVLKHLPGVLNLLRDAGYNDEEALRWLYEPDETLGGNAAIESGTVYHFFVPTLTDGSTTSPNMSRGTDCLLLGSSVFLKA